MGSFFIQHAYHALPVQIKEPPISKNKSSATKRAKIFMERIVEAQEYAAAAMASSQQLMEEQSNKKRNPAPLFKIGDKVWLNLKNIQSPQLKKKLAWVNAKYSVTKVISSHVVELDVPSQIYPKFHVELLRKASDDPLPSQIKDDTQPTPILIENENLEINPEQRVQRILRAEKFRRGRGWVRRVLVKWEGFAEPTWENRCDLEKVEALDKFEAKFGSGDGVGENEGPRQGTKPKTFKNQIKTIGKGKK